MPSMSMRNVHAPVSASGRFMRLATTAIVCSFPRPMLNGRVISLGSAGYRAPSGWYGATV